MGDTILCPLHIPTPHAGPDGSPRTGSRIIGSGQKKAGGTSPGLPDEPAEEEALGARRQGLRAVGASPSPHPPCRRTTPLLSLAESGLPRSEGSCPSSLCSHHGSGGPGCQGAGGPFPNYSHFALRPRHQPTGVGGRFSACRLRSVCFRAPGYGPRRPTSAPGPYPDWPKVPRARPSPGRRSCCRAHR